ncbi:single-stranded-DNA-specific exonuclease RecJ [Vagococcus penaei]|uniref:Single-stranded-DNA-specific exonuclease RecJ n=1 Tax=Vagococcus penaei TaxID=633807 RepID=A0A1Q2D441_9ENTE|nr:single-stranded-DNA-specific exonuclease RecJ [Vagococcus penaei]AQP53071.1 single-stranded-DNA-specific exonuclease RecJ [Vagococcus penaei]
MRNSQFDWQLLDQNYPTTDLADAVKEQGLSEKLVPLLLHRKVDTAEKLATFLAPTLNDLHDPMLLHDMEKSINRVQEAIAEDQTILIYGDYDADGITSTTVMKDTLELIGANVLYYLPNRFKDGYGPNLKVYQEMIETQGVQLIITVDNGVSGHEAIAYAQGQGVDVIVTDHHELPDELPNAFAIVHPKHPDADYPFKDLAGVGVAFKFATALLGEIPVEALDLVAIGSIADMVSLTGENRILVKLGLNLMKQTDRIGLHALAEVTGTSLSESNEETVGFQFAPRLNALGRLDDATPGVELLSTFDEDEAKNLAEMIQEVNTKRQAIVKEITTEALAMIDHSADLPINILVKEGWHEGVLGIVANHVVKQTHKPALILTVDPVTKIVKGSGRSIEALDLFQLLNQAKDLFIGFGGHHMAAGLSFALTDLEAVKERLASLLLAMPIDLTQKDSLLIDETLALADVTIPYIKSFDCLRPFGVDNKAPIIRVVGERIDQLKQIGSDKSHLKFSLTTPDSQIDCIGFSSGSSYAEFLAGDSFEVVGQLSINEWNGRQKPQLMMQDFQINGLQIFDIRGKKANDVVIDTHNVCCVLFDEQLRSRYATISDVVLFSEIADNAGLQARLKHDALVLLDCPTSLDAARQLVSYCQLDRLYLKCDVAVEHYLKGMPKRDDFGKLFKVIKEHQQFDIRYKLANLANYLKIDKDQLIFMIKVFFELGFVTIDDGVMKRVDNPEPHPLTESQEYQSYLKRIDAEKLFVYSDVSDIKEWLLQQEET